MTSFTALKLLSAWSCCKPLTCKGNLSLNYMQQVKHAMQMLPTQFREELGNLINIVHICTVFCKQKYILILFLQIKVHLRPYASEHM